MDPLEKIETESSDGSKTDESEGVEPVLSYERMKGDITTILSDDFASCMCVNSRILILGTHWGKVHLLDHLGNRIKTYDNVTLNCHQYSFKIIYLSCISS
jgi:vacuolar protein sorting-associated protein 41